MFLDVGSVFIPGRIKGVCLRRIYYVSFSLCYHEQLVFCNATFYFKARALEDRRKFKFKQMLLIYIDYRFISCCQYAVVSSIGHFLILLKLNLLLLFTWKSRMSYIDQFSCNLQYFPPGKNTSLDNLEKKIL